MSDNESDFESDGGEESDGDKKIVLKVLKDPEYSGFVRPKYDGNNQMVEDDENNQMVSPIHPDSLFTE